MLTNDDIYDMQQHSLHKCNNIFYFISASLTIKPRSFMLVNHCFTVPVGGRDNGLLLFGSGESNLRLDFSSMGCFFSPRYLSAPPKSKLHPNLKLHLLQNGVHLDHKMMSRRDEDRRKNRKRKERR